jgi:hypothetical protein
MSKMTGPVGKVKGHCEPVHVAVSRTSKHYSLRSLLLGICLFSLAWLAYLKHLEVQFVPVPIVCDTWFITPGKHIGLTINGVSPDNSIELLLSACESKGLSHDKTDFGYSLFSPKAGVCLAVVYKDSRIQEVQGLRHATMCINDKPLFGVGDQDIVVPQTLGLLWPSLSTNPPYRYVHRIDNSGLHLEVCTSTAGHVAVLRLYRLGGQ